LATYLPNNWTWCSCINHLLISIPTQQ